MKYLGLRHFEMALFVIILPFLVPHTSGLFDGDDDGDAVIEAAISMALTPILAPAVLFFLLNCLTPLTFRMSRMYSLVFWILFWIYLIHLILSSVTSGCDVFFGITDGVVVAIFYVSIPLFYLGVLFECYTRADEMCYLEHAQKYDTVEDYVREIRVEPPRVTWYMWSGYTKVAQISMDTTKYTTKTTYEDRQVIMYINIQHTNLTT